MSPSGPAVAAPPAVDEALAAAADAAASALPADGTWSTRTADADTGGSGADTLGSNARAVAAGLPGLGRLVLAVAEPLAREVQAGPPPAGDLPDGLRPALIAAAAAFGADAAVLTDYAEVPLAALLAGPGEASHGVALLDDGTHKAVLAFVAPVVALAPPAVAGHDFDPLPAGGAFAGGPVRPVPSGPIELLGDVEMGVTVELGRTRMLVRDILELSPGSVIELDRAAGAPIDVLVNGTLIARGEVVVIDEEFGIRITEVIGYEDGARPGAR